VSAPKREVRITEAYSTQSPNATYEFSPRGANKKKKRKKKKSPLS
jgi:hypothetical protein